MTRDEVSRRLTETGIDDSEVDPTIELLLWFGFLGTKLEAREDLYAHTTQFNLRRLTHPVEKGLGRFVIHPAFRSALAIS